MRDFKGGNLKTAKALGLEVRRCHERKAGRPNCAG